MARIERQFGTETQFKQNKRVVVHHPEKYVDEGNN